MTAKDPDYARKYKLQSPKYLRDKASGKLRASNRAAKQRQRGLPAPTRPMPDHCECCKIIPTGILRLDHDHTTGTFRGWLCNKYNVGIGLLGDDLDSVCCAVNYLIRS